MCEFVCTYVCLCVYVYCTFFGLANLKRTRCTENEKLPYLFRSRFDSIRRTIVEKFVCVYLWHKFVLSAQFSILLFAVIIVAGTRIPATFILYVQCACIRIVLYCMIGKFQLNRPIFERLFNFFSYCCSQFRSFFFHIYN